jgi:hypothetical protein
VQLNTLFLDIFFASLPGFWITIVGLDILIKLKNVAGENLQLAPQPHPASIHWDIFASLPTYFTRSLFSTRGCVDMMREIPFHGVFHFWITHGDNIQL